MLSFIEPAAPTLVDEPPSGEGWIHEIKQDGFRTQLIIDDGRVRAFSSGGIDWTTRYGEIVTAAGRLKAAAAIIDGEMIVADEQGRSDFHALARAIKARPQDLQFVAFDLLHLNGEDLRQSPLTHRRERLEALIKTGRTLRLVFSRAFEGEGADVFAAIENLGLEGIVSKRANSIYRSGKKSGWLKIKSFAIDEYDVIGVDKTPAGAPVVLLVDSAGAYAGHAFLTVPDTVRGAFWHFVEQHRAASAPKGLHRKGAVWLDAALKAKVKHLRGEEQLRHASVTELTVPRVSYRDHSEPNTTSSGRRPRP